ncbi:lemA [Symbiodinium microadriaticum]|nr:lemA [Symbiodinium microadriaticum]
MESTIFLVVIAIIGLWGYSVYVRVIRTRNGAREALSGIDVQIKKRVNLVPNVLAIAKKFMQHEKALLTSVTEARTAFEKDYDPGDADAVKDHLEAAGSVSMGLGRILAVAEDYPELKSDGPMMEAQKTYHDVEDNLAAARRFYNSAVTDLNNIVEVFPMSVIAGWAKVSAMPYFELDPDVSRDPIDAAAILGVDDGSG